MGHRNSVAGKKRRSKFQPKKLPFKQRMARMVFRSLPNVGRAILILSIMGALTAAGMVGWKALAQSGGGGEPSGGTPALENERSVTYKYDPYTEEKIEEKYSDGTRRAWIYRTDHPQLLDRVETYVPQAGGGEKLVQFRNLTYNTAIWRVSSVTSPQGIIYYEYNQFGDLDHISTSQGDDVRFVRDPLMHLVNVHNHSSGEPGYVSVSYEYEPTTGRLSKVKRSNGTETDWSYDSWGRVSVIEDKGAGSATLFKTVFTRDKRGLVTSAVESRDEDGGRPTPAVVTTWTHVYDPAKRLKTSTRAVTGGATTVYSYEYDDACNRTKQTIQTGGGNSVIDYSYNSLDQLHHDSNVTYEYDVYGNLRKETKNDGTWRVCFWDGEDHLVKAEFHDAQGGLLKTIAYGYDDLGALVSRQVDNGPPTYYLVDHQNSTGYSQVLCAYTFGDTNGGTSYLYGDGVGPLAQSTAGGAAQFIHTDYLGSTRLLTGASGAPVTGSAFDYSPYGELQSADATLTPFAFTGQWNDLGLGRQYHGRRWYNPAAATWLSQDSGFDFPNNFGNPYLYVGANPINNTDPTGTFSLSEINVTAAIQNTLQVIRVPAMAVIANGRAQYASWMMSVQTMGTRIATAMPLAMQGVQRFYQSALQASRNPAWLQRVWQLGWAERGRQIEEFLLQGLPNRIPAALRNFPTIDRFWNGMAQSIKSIDTAAPTYQTIVNLETRLVGYVDKLSVFQGYTFGGVAVENPEITQRVLTVAVPMGQVSEAQMQLFARLIQYAANHGVELEFIAL